MRCVEEPHLILIAAEVRFQISDSGVSVRRLRAEVRSGVGIVGLRLAATSAAELAGEVGIHHGLGVENELAERIERHERARRDEAVGDGGAESVPGGRAGFKSQPLQRFRA